MPLSPSSLRTWQHLMPPPASSSLFIPSPHSYTCSPHLLIESVVNPNIVIIYINDWTTTSADCAGSNPVSAIPRRRRSRPISGPPWPWGGLAARMISFVDRRPGQCLKSIGLVPRRQEAASGLQMSAIIASGVYNRQWPG